MNVTYMGVLFRVTAGDGGYWFGRVNEQGRAGLWWTDDPDDVVRWVHFSAWFEA